MRSKFLLSVTLVVFAAATYGCAGEGSRAVETSSGVEVQVSDTPFVAEGATSYFFDSTTDLVSFADFVVLATVHEETIGELPPDGEGLVRRDAKIRVDQILWKFTEEQVVPEAFDLQVEGFWYKSDEPLHPMQLDDAPRLEVGDQFIGAFIDRADGPVLVTQSSALPVKDGAVNLSEGQRTPRHEEELLGGTPRRDLHGKTIDEMVEVFQQSDPQPGNPKYAQVPDEHRRSRMKAVEE